MLDLDQTRCMVQALGGKRALILANHGLIACAGTVEQAVIDMIDLDRSCRLNLEAMATGQKLHPVPPEAARQARQVQTTPARWAFQWPGLVMELNRHGTDYDPKGWLAPDEVPTVDRVRAALERPRAGQEK